MKIEKHPQYIELENSLNTALKKKVNLLIVGLPGMGATFFVKKYLEKNKNIGYITDENGPIKDFTILDFDFNKNNNAIKIVDKFIRESGINQKFAVVLNRPDILNSEVFSSSVFSNHVYTAVWIKCMDFIRAKILVDDTKSDISDSKLKKILQKTGGIARLTRYFVLNPKSLLNNTEKLTQNSSFRNIFNPTIEVIKKCDEKTLEALGIKKNGKYSAEVLDEYFAKHPKPAILNLKVTKEGFLVDEANTTVSIRLLKKEAEIVKCAIADNGIISKEKISDIKWGNGSYDKYSDQAIKKTIQRINSKLKTHKFGAIRTLGYQLQEK